MRSLMCVALIAILLSGCCVVFDPWHGPGGPGRHPGPYFEPGREYSHPITR